MRRVVRAAYVLLLFARVELGLRLQTLDRLCAGLGVRLGDGTAAGAGTKSPQLSAADVRRMMRMVDGVASNWPFGDSCLRRVLVLARLMRLADPSVVVGVKRGPDPERPFLAHAWLELEGHALDPAAEAYAAVEFG